MPKIIINEYDNTKPGQTAYANFAVVVPGFVGADKTEDIFDENGIYECSSRLDFETNIGKVSAELTLADKINPVICSELYYYAPNYTRETALNQIKEKLPGSFEGKFNEGEILTTSNSGVLLDLSDETELDKIKNAFEAGTLYKAISNIGTDGKLIKPIKVNEADELYYYEKVANIYSAVTEVISDADSPQQDDTGDETGSNTVVFEVMLEANTFYCVITTTDKEKASAGYTGVTTVVHYGNQIAWELLGMGYTVLYKRLKRDWLTVEESEGSSTDTEATDKPNIKFVSEMGKAEFWECLKDRATYDFRYVLSGLIESNSLVNEAMIGLVHRYNKSFDDISENGRGDCIALLDIDRNKYAGKPQAEAIPLIAQEGNKYTSQYAATFAPTVTYDMALDPAFGNNCTFPGSFHYLACAAKSSENYNEWYANAGYTRGVCKYNVASTGCKFGEMAIQALEPRSTNAPFSYKDTTGKIQTQNVTSAVNLIVKIKNSYYLWGNRTAYTLTEKDLVASHFLNVRQLCTTIKKQVYTACRQFTYEPNSDLLWIKFCSALEPMLEKMKADQGIKNYEILQIKHDRKAMLQARLRIVPIEAVEDFYINMMLVDSISGVDVEAVE